MSAFNSAREECGYTITSACPSATSWLRPGQEGGVNFHGPSPSPWGNPQMEYIRTRITFRREPFFAYSSYRIPPTQLKACDGRARHRFHDTTLVSALPSQDTPWWHKCQCLQVQPQCPAGFMPSLHGRSVGWLLHPSHTASGYAPQGAFSGICAIPPPGNGGRRTRTVTEDAALRRRSRNVSSPGRWLGKCRLGQW
ncbi:hypothetical protein BR93DRAFT_740148 [Coniochaeta sp. PMI_546]|nr:hypothetical protein BR93DRAFT_740148 [Coniochaeta sp. PMI_546]